MSLSDWPSGPVLYLDAENVDGEDNALIAHRDDIHSWKNQAVAGVDFVKTATLAQVPLMKKQAGSASEVSFDGRSDMLTCPNSATDWSFIHETGVFDMVIVLRRRGGANAGERRVFGSGPKGLSMAFTEHNPGISVEGGVRFFFTNGVAELASFIVKSIDCPLGEVRALFIRGDGTQLRITRDFWNWESKAYQNPFIAGDASEDYAIGTAAGLVGTEVLWAEFELLKKLLWRRNISADEFQDKVRPEFDRLEALPARPIIASLGDSLTLGEHADAGFDLRNHNWTSLCDVNLFPEAGVANFGKGGDTVQQMHVRYTDFIKDNGFARINIWAPINNVVQDESAATIWAALEALIDEAIADACPSR